MHRQFVDSQILAQENVALPHAEARHFINVLRLKEGDTVELFDGKGTSALYMISSATRGNVSLMRQGNVARAPLPPCRIILGACISKGKRMDWTVEKAVELGVSAILPIISDFSVVRIEKEDVRDKRERWFRVAADAARQCGTSYIPEILEPVAFEDAMDYMAANAEISFAGALTNDSRPFRAVLDEFRAESPVKPKSAGWLIGPEGDFSPAEYDSLRQHGVKFVSLGSLVLRTETAAMYGLCVLNAEWLTQSQLAISNE